MVEQVNKKLPEREQFSCLWWHLPKTYGFIANTGGYILRSNSLELPGLWWA
jgi:hypothetical protein